MRPGTQLLLIGLLLFISSLALTYLWNQTAWTSHGVRVVELMTNAPAQRAGIIAGDIILAIDNVPTRTSQEFVEVLQRKTPGDTVLATTARSIIPALLDQEPLFNNARLGVYVDTEKSYHPLIPEHLSFSIETVLTLTYWLGILHLVAGVALLKTSPLIEFTALNVLNVLDLATTHYFLNLGKVEGNPVGQFLLQNFGFTGTATIKITIVLIGSALLVWMSNKQLWKRTTLAKKLLVTHRLHLKGSILVYLVAVLVNMSAAI
ncbi:PDZ domain-containing protein [Candidatus Woesearchaeota archaeon]|nr:PDZ domain-containing protein [Candidatus Woesearchaeota archaeon]